MQVPVPPLNWPALVRGRHRDWGFNLGFAETVGQSCARRARPRYPWVRNLGRKEPRPTSLDIRVENRCSERPAHLHCGFVCSELPWADQESPSTWHFFSRNTTDLCQRRVQRFGAASLVEAQRVARRNGSLWCGSRFCVLFRSLIQEARLQAACGRSRRRPRRAGSQRSRGPSRQSWLYATGATSTDSSMC